MFTAFTYPKILCFTCLVWSKINLVFMTSYVIKWSESKDLGALEICEGFMRDWSRSRLILWKLDEVEWAFFEDLF